MQSTTVATNAVLTGKGAKVCLVTTAGFESTLQVARSFCPGGLVAGSALLKAPFWHPLELTIGAKERMSAKGDTVRALDEAQLRVDLQTFHYTGMVDALTICFINAYLNPAHEQRAKEIAAKIFTNTPIYIQ